MYAKIIDDKTKLCEVGTGTNAKFYQSIGMTDIDVEQAYDGRWYVAGYAPSKPEPTKEEQLAALDAQYEADKQEILNYYTEAMFAGDTDMQADLKSEMQEIEAEYIKNREELEGAE